MLRIPDVTILKITGIEIEAMRASRNIDWSRFIPTQRNIETILEIKFPGDRLSSGQKRDYPKIAGDGDFVVMTINDCDCNRKRREPVKEPVRVPVTTPMKRENTEAKKWYQLAPPQPAPAPAPMPRSPQYGPIAQKSTDGTTLSDWLWSAGKTVAKGADVVAVGALAIGTGFVIAALLPVEATAAAVVLVVVGAGAALNNGHKKDDNSV